MSLDPELHDQARQLFLQEALELLEQIQQGLSALQRDSNLSQINSLVRSIQLLKSGAAQLGLTDVYDLAHRFENILRSIWQTSSEVDGELSELLRQAHRCLHLTLLSRLTMERQDTLGFFAEAEFVLSLLEELLNQPQIDLELPEILDVDEDWLVPLDLTLEEILDEPILSLEEWNTNNQESSPQELPIVIAKTDSAGVANSEVALKTTKLFVWQANFMVFTIPYDNIEEYLIPKADQLIQSEQQRFLAWREQTIPLYQLSKLLSSDVFLPATQPPRISKSSHSASDRLLPILVIKIDSLLLALEVAIEKLVTEPELSLQTFGEIKTSDSYFLGCTYLSGNRLLPAIDVTVLLSQKVDLTQSTASATTLSNLLNAAIADKIAASQAALSEVAPHLPTLLVVEDSLTWRQFLVFTLQKAGYRVLQARDGQEGLKQLQQNSTILLIVTDLEMPNLNGFGFLICCRQDPTLVKVPVVVLSNYSSEQHRQLAMQLGANAYFSKPYDEREFLGTIASLIKKNKVNSIF